MTQTKYKEQMDALHVPKEKAEETLRLMLAENKRLRRMDEEKRARKIKKQQVPLYALAAAACFMLVFFGLRQWNHQSPFLSIKTSDLPTAEISRGGEDVTFQEIFGCEPEKLFSGWAVEDEGVDTVSVNGSRFHEAYLSLKKDAAALSAVVTDYEPPLLTMLKKEAKAVEGKLYLAKDTDANTLYAAYEEEGRFIVLSAENVSEDAFQKSVVGMK